MIARINELLQEVEALKAANAEELEALRIKYLSKKGAINELMADFRNVPADQKKEVGMRLNELKNKAQEKIAALKEQFESRDNGCEDLDLTRSAYPVKLGTRHPLSIVKNEIIDIFARMGFNIADGPEVEDDWHVFSAMNFAEDHPARDMQDTFFIENNAENVSHNIILRTHTSSVQSRVMENTQPPIRIICPGRVYRNEAISYRAHAFFHQVEALFIDRNVSFTDLKQALLLFAQEMFGKDTKIRLRPSYFPFTEPSAEMDICVLLQLPIVYFMDKFYYFNDNNIRYTIGTYYKDGIIINSSSSKEKGFIYYVDSIKHVVTTSKFNNTDMSHTHVLIMFSAVFHGNANVLNIIVPKWVLAPPKGGWKQFPPDINWKGAELDTAYMKKMNLEIP